MKKIEAIVEKCEDCRFCQVFTKCREDIDHAFICMKSNRVIEIQKRANPADHPQRPSIMAEWCPLESYADRSHEAYTAHTEDRGTLILPGLPHLEWMPENLTGFGGTEIDGRWYYTYDEAVEAVKQLYDGWRLPTRGEMLDLDDLGSEWQENGPHGLPGRLFGGGLFLDAAGYRHYTSGALVYVGSSGLYWSSSSYSAGGIRGGCLRFSSGGVNPLHGGCRADAFSVRCVRNRQ